MGRATCKGCGKKFKSLAKHLGHTDACRMCYYVKFDKKAPETEANSQVHTAIWNTHFQAQMDQQVFKDVANLFFLRFVGALVFTMIVSMVRRWMSTAIDSLILDLTPMLGGN